MRAVDAKAEVAAFALGSARSEPLAGNRGMATRIAWYVVSLLLFEGPIHLPYALKRLVLVLFGARIGKGLVVKPRVQIKYPWFLEAGDFVWLGENVWIDNLAPVTLGSNVCISQGALVLTGNHNYKSERFDRFSRPVLIGDHVWIGARSVVCPGAVLRDRTVLTVGCIFAGTSTGGTVVRAH